MDEWLSKVAYRAARMLGISRDEVQQVVDSCSPQDGRQEERALLLTQIAAGLSAATSGDPENMQHWLRTRNTHLGGVPIDIMATHEGLDQVWRYLSYMTRVD